MNGAVHTIQFAGGAGGKIAGIIDEEGEKMREAHIREKQVVDTITQLQCFINPGEDRNNFPVAFYRNRFEMFLYFLYFIELG